MNLLTADGYQVVAAETITYNPEMRGWECVIDGAPNLITDPDGTAHALSAEPGKRRVSGSITPRQARLALLAADLLYAVESAFAKLPEQQRKAAQIEWEFALAIERNSPLVSQFGPLLGLTEAQIDELFVSGAQL